MNNPAKQLDIRKFLFQNKVGLFGLVETKIKSNNFSTVLNILGQSWQGINNNSHHPGGRIWIIWQPQVFQAQCIDSSSQHITIEVTETVSGDHFWYTVVYGSNDEAVRCDLWDILKETKIKCQGAWCICGDFNNVLNFHERIGRDVLWNEIRDFRDCVDYCEVQDISAHGAFFTWTNKQDPSSRVFSRIDRMMVNRDWYDMYPESNAYFMAEGIYDHNPCVCYRRMTDVRKKTQFKYFNMWSMAPEFKTIVNHEWNKQIRGTKMYSVVTKLKSLKKPLKALNRQRFSDVERATEVAKQTLIDIQEKMHLNPHNQTVLQDEQAAASSYKMLAEAQFRYLKQKAKTEWHGITHTDNQDIEGAFLDYYQDLLGTHTNTSKVHGPTVRTGPTLTDLHHQILLRTVTKDEVKASIFSIPPTKAPGPDGYSSQFFKDSWDIIGNEVTEAVLDFFQTGQLLKQLNCTNITLIPKVSRPVHVHEFRPIACCNILYKCIAKILCTRLGQVLPDIIRCNQGAFVKGRTIVENVLICQDLVRLYKRRSASPRCLLKIDLRKAYDTVEWGFVQDMLQKLNFPTKFIDMLMVCITTPSYSLALNGNNFGFFKGKRGLKQGDPLSPLIFTLYDLLLFCKGTELSIMWLLRSFSTFSAASGLKLNKEKSNIYFNGVPTSIIQNILRVSGFVQGQLPFKYLGVPISSKKISKNDGMKLVDKVVARLRSWGARQLSYAGRLTLVTSVLSTLHSYWASMFLIPVGIMNKIEATCRNYLWGGSDNYLKAPKVNWEQCCCSKEEGGLGIQAAKTWNKALLGKYIWWVASKKDHLWVRWISHVYMKGVHWTEYKPPVDCSWSWKKIAHMMPLFKQAYIQDKWLGQDKPYSIQAGYQWLRIGKDKVPWTFVCWNRFNIPRHSFIYWAAAHQRLLTRDRMKKMGFGIDETCFLCGSSNEDHQHLFSDCPFSTLCFKLLQQKLHIQFPVQHLVTWQASGRGTSRLQRDLITACHVAIIYEIWQNRNHTRLHGSVRRPESIVQ
ncbi:uncharacterized protein LOC141631314 [Silene latifolia]|uniref:uncharacterized protein LOC141631314 n=1 Tax=Silene latifolia TaxID=37657 RepID=UPI003D77F958